MLSILYVEDDEDDREFLQSLLKVRRPDITLATAETGREALEYIKQSEANNVDMPCVIVLDLNLYGGFDGKEVFNMLRSDHRLDNVPVIILTSSNSSDDVNYFSGQCRASFFTKPITVHGYNRIVDFILTECLPAGESLA